MSLIKVSAALLLLCVALLPASPGAADAPAVVRVEPPVLTIGQGETATISVRLENAQNVYGIDVRLRFDPTVIEVLDTEAAKQGVQIAPGEFPFPDFTVLNTADNVTGTIKYASVQLNPRPPASGAGVIFSFQVRGKSAGRQTVLSVEAVDMADRNGASLPGQKQDGSVQISGAAAPPPPTATLPPESTPTITLPPVISYPASPTNTVAPATAVATPTRKPTGAAVQPTIMPAPVQPTVTTAATGSTLAPAAAPTTAATIATAPSATVTTALVAPGTPAVIAPSTAPLIPAATPSTMAAAFGRQTPPAAPAPSSETSSRFQAGTLVTILGIFMIAAGVALLAVMIVWMIRSRQAHQ